MSTTDKKARTKHPNRLTFVARFIPAWPSRTFRPSDLRNLGSVGGHDKMVQRLHVLAELGASEDRSYT